MNDRVYGRTNNFNIIRLIAALMVMAGHMGYITGSNVPILWGQGVQTIGVKIFFLLGGYFISRSWMSDPCLQRYGIKRIFRIFPPLIVYVLLATFIIGPLLSEFSIREYFVNPQTYIYLKNILLYPIYALPGIFVTNPYPNAINGSLWTMPVEIFLYILVPIVITVLCIKSKEKESFRAIGVLTILICLFQVVHLEAFPEWRLVIWGTDVAQAFTLIPYYFLGMLFNFPWMKKILNLQAAVLLALLYTCVNLSAAFSELILYLVLPYLFFSLGMDEKPYFAGLFNKYEISYGIYLYGFFIQQIVVWLSRKWEINLPFIGYLIISILLTGLLALVSCILIEKPSQKLCRKLCEKCQSKTNDVK